MQLFMPQLVVKLVVKALSSGSCLSEASIYPIPAKKVNLINICKANDV